MVRHFAVTITAAGSAVDAQTLAARLADLLGQPTGDIEEAVTSGTVIIQRELNYTEAIEFQRELNRRRIPAQVVSEATVEGVELLLRASKTARAEVSEEFISIDEGDSPALNEPQGWESLESVDDEENEKKRGQKKSGDEPCSMTGNAWAELFPDLEEQNDDDDEEPFVDPAPAIDVARVEMPSGAVDSDDIEFEDFQAPPQAPEAVVETDAPESFDAGVMRQAFVDPERPPFKPRGYDSRPEHVPLVAALLSLIAPGAGQIYNGQPRRAQRYAFTFFLLYPWYKSITQAWTQGEKIRTYFAPRPEEGATRRAGFFGLKWWLTVVLLASFASWSISSIEQYQQKNLEQQQRLQFQQLLFFGQDLVADAVLDGIEAAEEAEIESADEVEMQHSMAPEERARRLFIVGYHQCQRLEYQMCEAAMRRVTLLATNNRDAFRLQAWASVQMRQEDRSLEMPDVGPVPTLEEFELELSLRGMDLEDAAQEWWDETGFSQGGQ